MTPKSNRVTFSCAGTSTSFSCTDAPAGRSADRCPKGTDAPVARVVTVQMCNLTSSSPLCQAVCCWETSQCSQNHLLQQMPLCPGHPWMSGAHVNTGWIGVGEGSFSRGNSVQNNQRGGRPAVALVIPAGCLHKMGRTRNSHA